MNKGVDIGGDAGDPVKAAADGSVVYAGSGLLGYGNLIIVNHSETFLSAYAHNRKILVEEGQDVGQGDTIAEMGESGADRIMLHFEVRRQGDPVDPMQYLPRR
ncbi:MAG: peptidoglycan DD-metalloendopeptidase family protein [Halospina sp.]